MPPSLGSPGSSGAYRAPGRGGGGGGWGDDVVLPTGPSARPDDEDDAQRPGGRGPGMKYGDEKLGGAFKDYGGDRGGGATDTTTGATTGARQRRRGAAATTTGAAASATGAAASATGTGAGPRLAAAAPAAIAIATLTRATVETGPPALPRRRGRQLGPQQSHALASTPRPRRLRRAGASADRDPRSLRLEPKPPGQVPVARARLGPLRNRRTSPSQPQPLPRARRDWGALRNRTGPPPRSRSRSPKKERDWGAHRNRAGPPPRDERDERAARGPRPGQRADEAGDRWGKKDARDLSPRGDRDRDRDGDRRPRLNLQKRSEQRAAGGGDDAVSGGGSSSLFGGARPRELALKEAGRDYRKEDAALSRGGVRRRESNEERALKADIAALHEKLGSNPDDEALKSEISDKEDALAKLALELDDKVRFAQREEKARNEERGEGKAGRRESRREPRGGADRAGNWGEGKTDRQSRRRPRWQGAGRERRQEGREEAQEPRVMKVAEETGVKIASSSFAALALEEE